MTVKSRTRPALTIKSFGCRLNIAESESIRATLSVEQDASLVVINGCAVTAGAMRDATAAVRRSRREQFR
jgi:threonylcarbamoyladenosine tRNA methylthiotransferase MtaB